MVYDDEEFPQGKILHKHYVKPMASRLVVQRSSAISERNLWTIYTQEIIRCLSNCHKDIPEEEVNEIEENYMKKLQNSGYDEKFRREVLQAGTMGFEKQKVASETGGRPLYRPRGYKKVERYNEKDFNKTKWFNNKESKDDYEAFIMVPATPGSELKKRIEEKWKTLGVMQKVKVIEKPGKKFGDVLKMNNRSQKSKRACTDERCLVGDKGGNCRTN